MKTPIERRIRESLKERNMTVTDLSKAVGVSRVALYYLFRGNFSREMLTRISDVLGIPPHVLIAPDGEELGSPAGSVERRFLHAYRRTSARIREAVEMLLGLRRVPDGRKPVIVVVDDIPENTELLKRCLRKDFEVIEFTDPFDALEAIRRGPVDAVVSDQRMPSMTGTELFKRVDEIRAEIPKLIVSAYADNQAFLAAINETRVDGFLVKPFEPSELRNRLNRLLRAAPTTTLPN